MNMLCFILLVLAAWCLFCFILAVGEWIAKKAYFRIKPYRDFVDRVSDE